MQVGVADRGVSGVASFLLIPLLLLRDFSGDDELLEREDLDFSGDDDDLDLDAESRCE